MGEVGEGRDIGAIVAATLASRRDPGHQAADAGHSGEEVTMRACMHLDTVRCPSCAPDQFRNDPATTFAEAYPRILEVEVDRLRARTVELETALAEETEACAKVAEAYEPACESCPRGVASAIRARGRNGFQWKYPNGGGALR